MSPIASVLRNQARKIAALTGDLGRRVQVAGLGITDRAGELPLGPAGELVSPNGACRMFRTADGWMALNLARPEDHDLVPAWLETEAGDPWALVQAHAPERTSAALRDRAILLGLPACEVGEMPVADPEPLRVSRRGYASAPARTVPHVVDLSAMWAGPVCGAILAAMGAQVVKVESVRRPDPSRTGTPGLYQRLNGAKAHLGLDLAEVGAQARLRDMILDADVVITSARRRGLASIGLDPDQLIFERPGLTWVAITGYGLGLHSDHPWYNRVAFGDDAAAAGGLVGWTPSGEPRFLGDALADPITGLAAAVGALRSIASGGGCVVEAAMAERASRAAMTCAVALPG